jgi:hydrogenase-4 membrane subunit HyfE
MLNFIPQRFAATTLIVLFILIIIFHGLALAGIIPYNMLRGGRLQNYEQMLVFETVSIILNVLMLAIVSIHTEVLKIKLSKHVTTVALWIMSILFLMYTFGNLVSKNELEKIIFTPVTLLLTLLCLRLALLKHQTKNLLQ